MNRADILAGNVSLRRLIHDFLLGNQTEHDNWVDSGNLENISMILNATTCNNFSNIHRITTNKLNAMETIMKMSLSGSTCLYLPLVSSFVAARTNDIPSDHISDRAE